MAMTLHLVRTLVRALVLRVLHALRQLLVRRRLVPLLITLFVHFLPLFFPLLQVFENLIGVFNHFLAFYFFFGGIDHLLLGILFEPKVFIVFVEVAQEVARVEQIVVFRILSIVFGLVLIRASDGALLRQLHGCAVEQAWIAHVSAGNRLW